MGRRIAAHIPRWLGIASALLGVSIVLTADIPEGAARRRVISGVVFVLAGVGLVSSGTKLLYNRDHNGGSSSDV